MYKKITMNEDGANHSPSPNTHSAEEYLSAVNEGIITQADLQRESEALQGKGAARTLFDGLTDADDPKLYSLDNVYVLAELSRAEQEEFFVRLRSFDVAAEWVRTSLKPAVREAGKIANQTTYIDYHEAFSDLGYNARLNLLDDSVEINGSRLDDVTEARILCRLNARGLKNVELARRSLLMLASDNQYHPVKDFLQNLEWDGIDHIATLASYFTDAHEPIVYADGTRRSVFHAWLYRWLIGSVGKVFDSAENQNPMLVLDGTQGKGKSFFARWICPVGPLHFEGAIRPEDKDYLIYLCTKWVWEVGELGGTMRKADREFLKQFLTQQEVTVRQSYGRYSIRKPALSSFIGTVNNESGILNDPTGHRRFRPVTITKIDYAYSREIDIDQVWAQACYLYKQGETWKLSEEEQPIHDEICSQFEVEDPLESWLYKDFDIDPENTDWAMTSAEIADRLQARVRGTTHSIQIRVGPTLKRLGLGMERRRVLIVDDDGNEREIRQRAYIGIRQKSLLDAGDNGTSRNS